MIPFVTNGELSNEMKPRLPRGALYPNGICIACGRKPNRILWDMMAPLCPQITPRMRLSQRRYRRGLQRRKCARSKARKDRIRADKNEAGVARASKNPADPLVP